MWIFFRFVHNAPKLHSLCAHSLLRFFFLFLCWVVGWRPLVDGRLRWEGKWQLQCNSQIEKSRSVATLHKRPSYGAAAAFSKFLFFFIIGGAVAVISWEHTHTHCSILCYIYRIFFSVALSLKLDSVKPPFTWCGFVFKMFSNKRCVCALPYCVGLPFHIAVVVL